LLSYWISRRVFSIIAEVQIKSLESKLSEFDEKILGNRMPLVDDKKIPSLRHPFGVGKF
jgi:hypothetical protein